MTRSRAYGWAQSYQRRRSARSREMDAKRKARQTFGEDLGTEDYRRWKRHPGRYDIQGIDTPAEVVEAPVVKTPAVPERDDWGEIPGGRSKKRSNPGRGYSSSWWQRNVTRERDPVQASRNAARAIAFDNMDYSEDDDAYLEDTAYVEIDPRWRHDRYSRANARHEKMLSDFRLEEADMAGRSYSSRSGSETERLAWDIVDLAYDFDPYEFRDQYGSREEFFAENMALLSTKKGIGEVIEFFDGEPIDFDSRLEARRQDILKRLRKLSTTQNRSSKSTRMSATSSR